MYTSIESLCCTSEINMFYDNYTKKITETVRCEIKKNQIEMLKYDLRKKLT